MLSKIDAEIRKLLLSQGLDVEQELNEMIEDGYIEINTDKDIGYGSGTTSSGSTGKNKD